MGTGSSDMQILRQRVSETVISELLAAVPVRADAVARARALLASDGWCRADEVAAELVDCYVAQRLP